VKVNEPLRHSYGSLSDEPHECATLIRDNLRFSILDLAIHPNPEIALSPDHFPSRIDAAIIVAESPAVKSLKEFDSAFARYSLS
jgi:hypothetical protein